MNPKPFNSAIIIQQENEETVCVCYLKEMDKGREAALTTTNNSLCSVKYKDQRKKD